jgi:hypothetical protein
MKNTDKRSDFERAWQEAFEQAELSPPDAVWNGIDHSLLKDQANDYRRRLVFFKWLTAASMVFALGFGLYYYFSIEGQSDVTIAENQSIIQPENTPKDITADAGPTHSTTSENAATIAGPSAQEGDDQAEKNGKALAQPNNRSAGSIDEAVTNADDPPSQNLAFTGRNNDADNMSNSKPAPYGGMVADQSAADDIALNSSARHGMGAESRENLMLATLSAQAPQGHLAHPQLQSHLYLVPVMPTHPNKNRATEEPELFAGLNFSTGLFDPNISNGAGSYASNSLMALDQSAFSKAPLNFNSMSGARVDAQPAEEYAADVSYAYGFNVGARIFGRWVLETGMNYVQANSTATTTAYLENTGSDSRYALLNTYRVSEAGIAEVNRQASPLDVNNSYEFLSVPLKAGYMVLRQPFNVTLMAGVASDFFLGNGVSDDSGFITAVSNSPGADSPYRNIMFNGLMSTNIGYTIAEQYSLSIEPSYRMALSSLTKNDFVLDSRPASVQIMLGLSYRFR